MNDKVETRLKPVWAIEDFDSVARDLTDCIKMPENLDIVHEFPGTLGRLGSNYAHTVDDLRNTAERCEKGQHEVFVAFAGSIAIGLSWITTRGETPKSIVEQSAPNVSGFIANPWRSAGLARLILADKMKILEENFGPSAWTLIDKKNTPSMKIAHAAGFSKMPKDKSVDERFNLFSYSSFPSPGQVILRTGIKLN